MDVRTPLGNEARRGRWRWLLGLGAVGLTGYAVMARESAGQSAAGNARAPAVHAIPVMAAAAVTRDVGVYLT